MRTTKRFDDQVLARFARQGRSEGVYDAYTSWHQVSRGDPSSIGRSHIPVFEGRSLDLLSDVEDHVYQLGMMLPDLDDLLTQYKLSLERAPHLLSKYGDADKEILFPGTVQLAKELGIPHPKLSGDGGLWPMTSDIVFVQRPSGAPRRILAVAIKPTDKLPKRQRAKLRLEREFWLRRGCEWLLITPSQIDPRVQNTLSRTQGFALSGYQATEAERALAVQVAMKFPCESQTQILQRLAIKLGSIERAQGAFWQAVWKGELRIDLTLGWRPWLPVRLVGQPEFENFNPLQMRRSAWNETS